MADCLAGEIILMANLESEISFPMLPLKVPIWWQLFLEYLWLKFLLVHITAWHWVAQEQCLGGGETGDGTYIDIRELVVWLEGEGRKEPKAAMM